MRVFQNEPPGWEGTVEYKVNQIKTQGVASNCSIFLRSDISLSRVPSCPTLDRVPLSHIFHLNYSVPFLNMVHKVEGGIFKRSMGSGIRQNWGLNPNCVTLGKVFKFSLVYSSVKL